MKALLLFQKTYFCLFSGLCMLSGIWLSAVTANAQARDTPVKSATIIGTEQNPFDFVLQAAENQGQLKQSSKSFQQKIKGRAYQGTTPALQYRKKFGGTAEQAQVLLKTLMAKYGEPKSIRGQSHVWDIKNPSRGNGQAGVVTIILKMGEAGGYELIMDRDRGEDGLATWAAPRIEPAAPQKKQRKITQFKPILQPDND